MISISDSEGLRKLKSFENSNATGVVIHFSAKWCNPCAAIRSLLEEKIDAYKEKTIFAEVDCEKYPDICEAEGVDRVPLVVFYRKSSSAPFKASAVAEVAGAKIDKIEQNLSSLYGFNRDSYETLQGFLEYLCSRSSIVVFITGTPSRPRCGFTEKLCLILDEMKANYLYYDVMGSDEVCEGLKVFSEWPTYPQVYVDGVLIGGWDICKELYDNGELKKSLKI